MTGRGFEPEAIARRRAALIREIEAEAAATAHYTGRSRFRREVLEALSRVPRHLFVPPGLEADAYRDVPLAIGHGQTISQPFIVALMTDFLEVGSGDHVLEIGCGSGYQAAVLAELGTRVISVERVTALADAARERLRRLGYEGVEVRTGDGYFGCPEAAPYAGIIVTAAAPEIPPPLWEQLAPGGRMVIPIGLPHRAQELLRVEKSNDGSLSSRAILPVAFVPFLHLAPESGTNSASLDSE